ncbi:MAG: septal ring lytic transglycosylase RlpA family protein, partial [Bacteroidetes bacterium]|nr:septal ring lytic transglycosylase RlpA family protein [Bacteroidota bacterium]
MIITTRNVYSTVGLIIGLLVATALFFALPSQAQDQQGKVSWSAMNQHGRKTASGERYDHRALTAAHASLPFDTMVRVRNPLTSEQVVVRINDRTQDAAIVIGLSGAAAQKLGFFEQGSGAVQLWVLDTDQSVIIASADKVAGESERRSVPMNRGASMPENVATVPQPAAAAEAPDAGTLQMTSWFTLQIGSFATLEGAQELARSYEEAWVRPVETADGATYRVYFSRF